MAWRALQRLFGSSAVAPAPPKPSPPAADGRVRLKAAVFERARSTVPAVGESFRQPALEALGGGRTTRGVERTEHVAGLFHEPDNPKDPTAVAVQIDGYHVGYLARANARSYGPIIDLLGTKGLAFGCHASLTGGWDRGGGDRGSIGVVLHLGSPAELLAELKDGGLVSDDEAGVVPAPVEPAAPRVVLPVAAAVDLGNVTGKTVCFTGPSACTVGGTEISRASQEILATNAGLRVLPRVTKKLDMLVVSPFAERTGKVVRAEAYGIVCVDEPSFWRAIGVRIDATCSPTATPDLETAAKVEQTAEEYRAGQARWKAQFEARLTQGLCTECGAPLERGSGQQAEQPVRCAAHHLTAAADLARREARNRSLATKVGCEVMKIISTKDMRDPFYARAAALGDIYAIFDLNSGLRDKVKSHRSDECWTIAEVEAWLAARPPDPPPDPPGPSA
jgi:hypothetical protein